MVKKTRRADKDNLKPSLTLPSLRVSGAGKSNVVVIPSQLYKYGVISSEKRYDVTLKATKDDEWPPITITSRRLASVNSTRAFVIPKQFIRAGIIDLNKRYDITLKVSHTMGPLCSLAHFSHVFNRCLEAKYEGLEVI